jgi:hypothetical protein
MKKSILIIATILFSCTSLFASVSIKYSNKDNSNYKFKVFIDGVEKEVEFRGNKTDAVLVEGKATVCTIVTSYGKFEIKANDKVEIKGGMIRKVK